MKPPSTEHANDLLTRAFDSRHDLQPPRDVLWALYSLTGDAAISHIIGQSDPTEGSTTWRLTALTDTHLVLVEAESTAWQWAWDSREAPDRRLSAEIFDFNDLRSLRIAGLRDMSDPRSGDRWSADLVAVFGDREIALPASTTARNQYDQDAAEAMALAVREAFVRRRTVR